MMSNNDQPDPLHSWLASHNAQGILFTTEVAEMQRATSRVFYLLADGNWHTAAEIRAIAGNPGFPASEGLRRLRDLRKVCEAHNLKIEKTRGDSRLYSYRLQPA